MAVSTRTGPQADIMMETKQWNVAGVSLVELLITVVISGVLFASIGMVIVYANQAWQKSYALNSVLNDSRAAKDVIKIQLGAAVTRSFMFQYMGMVTPGTCQTCYIAHIPMDKYSYISPANPDVFAFNSIDKSNNRFKFNQYIYDDVNKRILYDYWYATTNAYNNAMYTGLGNEEVLVNNATGMTVTAINDTEYQVSITQSQQPVNGSAAQIIMTTTFIINARNQKP